MSTGTWDPSAAGAAPDLDKALLERLARLDEAGPLSALGEHLEAGMAGIMTLDHAQWTALADELDSSTVISLIRVLTVAEKLPGWEAAERSPVIPLAKSLRRRGEKLDRELLLWIREHSDNRYLPYGPL